MAPAVCQDSEDEDDDIFGVDLDNNLKDPSQESTHSWIAREAAAFLVDSQESPMDASNDPNPPGTTSSDLLRDVHNANLGLFWGTAPDESAMNLLPSSNSPALQRKRRQTENHESGVTTASPARSLKRAKTTTQKTYGSKSTKSLPQDDSERWAAFRDNDAVAAAAPTSETVAPTSETAQFSDHANDRNVGVGYPPGTLQQDFMDHEPAVMFRDSGSTVAYNESSEQRLVEQALATSTKQSPGLSVLATADSQKHDSSPFPYSASVKPTQSQQSGQTKSRLDEVPTEDHRTNDKQSGVGLPDQVPTTFGTTHNDQAQKPAEIDQQNNKGSARPVPKSSPVVEIPRRNSLSKETLPEPSISLQSDTTQKKTKGRRRKTHDSSDSPVELLNSDEREIGQPREQYKPRPSRRRATEIPQDSIDYSVVPEKAARKRRKTATASIDASGSDITDVTASIVAKTSTSEESKAAEAFRDNETSSHKKNDADIITVEPPTTETRKPEPTASPEKQPAREASDTPKSLKSSQDAIAMPPPSLPASATKKRPRRSHTTIFEDHVSPGTRQKSPSLSQQQADRRSVLQELPTEATQRKARKSRTVVDSDEDDEDELAKADEPAEETVVPKKRGRQPKAPAAKKAKSAEKVLEDSEDEDLDFWEDTENEPAAKKARGRPKKTQQQPTATKTTAAEKPQASEPVKITSSDMAAVNGTAESSPAKAALQRKDTNQQLNTNMSKETAQPASTPPKDTPASEKPLPTKASPVSHSPLKSQGVVPYRVGLSKRSRIPSLLKSFRPPPRQSSR